jgi:hypothetical protein
VRRTLLFTFIGSTQKRFRSRAIRSVGLCRRRISVLKRRHGLARCRYHGLQGVRRWVGLEVIADNLINIGRCLAAQPA